MQFMQKYIDWDQYAYAGNVRLALVPGNTALMNPHHLHFELGGKLFQNLMLDLFGKSGFTDLAFNLRLRSLLAACIGIFFCVLFLANATKRLLWGVIGGLLVGFLHGYLQYATKIDTGIFPAASVIPLFWAYGKMQGARSMLVAKSLLCGFLAFVCVMMHEHSVFAFAILSLCQLVPAAALVRRSTAPFAMGKTIDVPLVDSRTSNRLKAWMTFSLSGAVLIVAAYFYAGETHYNLRFDPGEQRESRGIWASSTFQRWLVSYATTDMWGHGIEHFDPRAPIRGFTDACLSQDPKWPKYNANYEFAYDMKNASSPETFSNDLLALLTLFTIAGAVALVPWLLRRYGRVYIALVASLAVYAVFFTYWEPFYFEFWIVPAVLVAILFVLVFAFMAEKLAAVLRGFGRIPFYALALFVFFVFATHNMKNYVIPYSASRYTQGISWSLDPDKYEWMYSPTVYKDRK